MEYYSRLKRNELSSYEKTWRKLKWILLGERSQSKKATYCITPTIWQLLFSRPVTSDSYFMDCSTPGLPVTHHLLKFAQVHVHCISDAIQPSHPLTPSSPSALNLSQHQGLFPWASPNMAIRKRQKHGDNRASLVAQTVKNPPAMWETWVRSLGWEDPLEGDMATHSAILAWRIPMNRGAWRATVHGVVKSHTEWINTWRQQQQISMNFSGWREEGMSRWSTEDFRVVNLSVRCCNGGYRSLSLLSLSLLSLLSLSLSKPIECKTARVNPNVNCGLWLMMMHQCRFLSCSNCTSLMWDVDHGGRLCICECRSYIGNFYFSVNLKLL